MSAPTDHRTLVLHGVRIKGFASPEVVAEAVGLPEEETAEILAGLVEEGLVTDRYESIPGFSITPEGRRQHALLVAAELEQADARRSLVDAYRRFREHNGELVALSSQWQVQEVDGRLVVNDHDDPAYDRAIIDRLVVHHKRATPVLADLAHTLDRYGPYQPRLDHAMERVTAGDTDWFTKPMIPSYHTIWFELHEDLLATLGIERGQEELV